MSYFQWVSGEGGLIPALQPDQFKETLRFVQSLLKLHSLHLWLFVFSDSVLIVAAFQD